MLRQWYEKFKPQKTHSIRTIIKGSTLGVIGFILSPLSWWNDLVINIPLAYLFAIVFTYLLQPIITFSITGFAVWLGIGYWITNILGFWFIHLGIKEFIQKKGHWIWDVSISLLYTIVVIVLAILGFSQPIADALHLVPSWIK
ncbi:hypothetical protein ACFLZY_01315 [Patescibacteria group bacterium]